MKKFNLHIKGSGTKEQLVSSLVKMINALQNVENSQFELVNSYCLDDNIVNMHVFTDNDVTKKPLEFFNKELSARAYNLLKDEGVVCLHDIAAMSRLQLRKHRNCGEHTLKSIEDLLAKYGLTLSKN